MFLFSQSLWTTIAIEKKNSEEIKTITSSVLNVGSTVEHLTICNYICAISDCAQTPVE